LSHSDSMTSVWLDLLSIGVTTVCLLILQQIIQEFGQSLSSKLYRKCRKFSDPIVRIRAERKVGESMWRFTYYTIAVVYGQYAIGDKPFFRDFSKLWGEVIINKDGQQEWYMEEIPMQLYVYYIAQFSFYTSATVEHLLHSSLYSRNKDSTVLLIHHFATMALIWISMQVQCYKVGCVIMIMHDYSDPFLELAKLFKYFDCLIMSKILFFGFFLVFHMTRLGIYPYYIIPSCIFDTAVIKEFSDSFKYFYQPFGVVLLFVILALNAVWSSFIIKMLFRVIFKGEIRDNRSEDEVD